MNTDNEPGFQTLLPNDILGAIESAGFPCSGDLLALNSYENRVYRAGLSSGERIVAKFYRPGRWPDAAILEEHDFATALAQLEVPVVPPINADGVTLHRHADYRFALYDCMGGRWPELDNEATARQTHCPYSLAWAN